MLYTPHSTEHVGMRSSTLSEIANYNKSRFHGPLNWRDRVRRLQGRLHHRPLWQCYTVAEAELSPFTTRTEHPALPTTFSVALPVNILSIVVFTGIPIMIRSTPLPPAVSTITS